MLRSTHIVAGPWRLHALRGGDPQGPHVALVHGLAISSRFMEALGNALSHQAHVLAPDLPGYGKTMPPPRPLDVQGMANVLAEGCDAAGLRRPVLVGVSYGCQVVVQAMAERPGWSSGAVLLGPTVDGQAHHGMLQVSRWLLDLTREPGGLAGPFLKDVRDAGSKVIRDQFKAMLDHRVEHWVPMVREPLLFLRGQHDPIVPRSWVRRLSQLAPRGAYGEIAGKAHTLSANAPEEVAHRVRRFMRGADPARARPGRRPRMPHSTVQPRSRRPGRPTPGPVGAERTSPGRRALARAFAGSRTARRSAPGGRATGRSQSQGLGGTGLGNA